MNLIIRPIRHNETILLLDYLYEAVHQPAASHLAPRTILQHPSLWKPRNYPFHFILNIGIKALAQS